MSISAGSTGRADDFIYRAETQADRADDEGRVPKLEDDGRLHPDFTIPTGIVVEWEGDSGDIPDGFLLCDGSAVSRTTYADLFAILGTKHGIGDGSTTFNLPSRKGRVAVGQDTGQTEFDTLGETGGEKTHQLSIAELPTIDLDNYKHDPGHGHSLVGGGEVLGRGGSSHGDSGGSSFAYQNIASNTTGIYFDSFGSNQAHNNLQPYVVTLFIIKT